MDKRNLGRFCIQFNVTDCRHLQVIELLETQGRRKAQYITEAVLHYANCSETPEIRAQTDTSSMRLLIETVVRELLKKEKATPAAGKEHEVLPPEEIPVESSVVAELTEKIDEDMLAAMRESISTLRDRDTNTTI